MGDLMKLSSVNRWPKISIFSGSDQIQTPQYPNVHPPSQETSKEVSQAKEDLMKSIETFLEKFNCIPFEEKPQILFQAWKFFFAVQYSKPEDSNELFQKLLEDLKELAEYDNSPEIDTSDSNEEKEEPPQDSDIRKLIREECCVEVSEEQKQNMEDTMQELVKICQQKELLCIHDNVKDLIESALNSKLLSINSNSRRLDNMEEEVKNIVEQPAKRGNRIEKSLQNFRVIHKSSISFKNSSQISSIHVNQMKFMKSGVEDLVPILSENEVTLKDKRECDVPIFENSLICDDHSDIFFDSKNDDDISVYDDFKDVEYVEASLSYPEIVSVEKENVVHQEEEDDDLEDISQIQDIVLREKLLSITRLISNIESLNDNPTPDCELNSFVSIPIFEESDNFLSDNFSPEFETFCDHTEETRSGNTPHANDSLPEYDSFCFEIDPDQERLINVLKRNIPNDSSNDPLLEEVDLFLAFDNSIPPGIENVADNSEGDIRFLEELLIDDSILSHESSDSNFEDNPSVLRPPPEPPDAEFDAGEEIPVVMNDKDEDVDYSSFIFVIFFKVFSFLSAESEDTIFDPARDSKFVVAFDESHCYVLPRDLREMELFGTDLVIGHPFDQVMIALKNDIVFEKTKEDKYCEICQKAKQTREPFPLSDHSTTVLGELVHLDLWGPYKVNSKTKEEDVKEDESDHNKERYTFENNDDDGEFDDLD
nr:ribonuclease H-like domain-containing protein [Tanacetum cinerariifolium]